MGYTHYYTQEDDISEEAWINVIVDLQKVIDYVEPNIKLESNDDNGIMLTNRRINLNGADCGEDLGHETFYVSREKDEESNWGFCKTAHKPYDIVVLSALLLIHHHYPEFGSIRSDGEPDDWKDAAELNAKVLGYAYQIPPEIGNTEEINTITKNIEEELNRAKEVSSNKAKIK